MSKQIYVNLPVKDLGRTRDFFTKLGFSFDPKFSDDNALCLIIGENIFAMLLAEQFFQTFTRKTVADANKTTEVLIAIDAENRKAVDELVKKAVKAGGREYREVEDHGWMYGRSFEDLDGHQWEVVYTDESQMPQE